MNWFVKILLPVIINTGESEATLWLQKYHDFHPQGFTQILLAFYPVIDVQFEDYAKETKSTVDDEVVARLKSLLEKLALANGITLPNLDAGKPND